MGFRGIGFLLQCYLMLASAMYFDLGEQEEKCIIEEIPEDTRVTGASWRGNTPPERQTGTTNVELCFNRCIVKFM